MYKEYNIYTEYFRILDDVLAQLDRQIEKWGIQNHPDGTEASVLNQLLALEAKDRDAWARKSGVLSWMYILNEEVREAFAEDPGTDELRTELIQVAAVAVAWIENIDRRKENS